MNKSITQSMYQLVGSMLVGLLSLSLFAVFGAFSQKKQERPLDGTSTPTNYTMVYGHVVPGK